MRPVVHLNSVWLPVAHKLFGAFRNDQLRPELLRLCVSARSELLPRDARGKAKIVLDLGARTGLPSRRVRFKRENIKSFRRAVHSRRKARRSGAYNNQVADLCLVNRLVEAKTIGELLIGRVAKYDLAVTDHNRYVSRADLEMIQQLLHVGVAVEVDRRIRVSVTGQELFDAKRPRTMTRPDDRNIS